MCNSTHPLAVCALADTYPRDALPSERRLVQLLHEAWDAAQAVVNEHDDAAGENSCGCDLCEEVNGVRWVIEKTLADIESILPPPGSFDRIAADNPAEADVPPAVAPQPALPQKRPYWLAE